VALSWHPDADSVSAWRPAGMRAQILSRRDAVLEAERRFHFGVAPSCNPDADFTSPCRAELDFGRGLHLAVAPSWISNVRAEIRTWIPSRRVTELESGRVFHLNVAPSWHPDADSTSAWRRAEIRTRILFRRGSEQKTRRGFHLDVAPRSIQTRIQLRRRAELKSGRGFHFGVALSCNPDADFTTASRRAGT